MLASTACPGEKQTLLAKCKIHVGGEEHLLHLAARKYIRFRHVDHGQIE